MDSAANYSAKNSMPFSTSTIGSAVVNCLLKSRPQICSRVKKDSLDPSISESMVLKYHAYMYS